MFVVVPLVRRMATAVVQIVDMITVRHRHMPAALAVHMFVTLVGPMFSRLALVEVTVVRTMDMPVVDVIDMVAVREGDVPATFTVNVRVVGVFLMHCRGHRTSMG